jgi:hypothetical protein
MPMSFPSAVSPPGGISYAAPLMKFDNFSNWAADDPYQKIFNEQQQQANQQKLDIAKTFQGGLPIDPKTGQVDYQKAVAMLAQKGDIGALWNGADAMLMQSATGTPLLPPPPQQGGQAPSSAAPPPASVQAKPLPAPAANSPQGDAGSGTIASIVTNQMPAEDAVTGQTIIRVAQVMGVDPNANLSQGQQLRANGLARKYAAEGSSTSASGRGGGDLPPSANAISPRPQAAPAAPASFNDRFAAARPGAAAPAQPAPMGAGPPPAGGSQQQPQPVQPQAPQGGPITPQVPLPPGFTDPMQAAQALHERAAQLSVNPRLAGKAQELNAWASRIEESIKPISLGPQSTMIDPRTRRVLAQGALAAQLSNPNAAPTLDADAERYRKTGTLPPNMGRGLQGQQESAHIRARAAELEIQDGGDPSKWADKWQEFRAKGIGLNTAERTKANREENLNLILKAADAAIPAALEASKALPRSMYVPLNRLIQKGEIMSSDPRLVEFGMANLQLAEHWARAMNPTGVMRESDRDKALHFLDTAYGGNTYERAVMQLQKQITRERDAVRGGSTILKDNKAPDPAADLSGTPDKDGWISAPNGALIRKKTQ